MPDDVLMQVNFVKGHGTENDFVLVPDEDGSLELSADQVARLSDRRTGIGADGVIRVVQTGYCLEVADQAEQAEWFMDYRNADGSAAQMCGNGLRVFVAYLFEAGLIEPGEHWVATRSGPKRVLLAHAEDGITVTVDLGGWRIDHGQAALAAGGDCQVRAAGWPGSVPGLSVNLGNPHTVVMLPSPTDVAATDLSRRPEVDPVPTAGSNIELVAVTHTGRLRMRVHERGVGETRSCGTGAAAAALAARAWGTGPGQPSRQEWVVEVPGGTLGVRVHGGDVHGESVELTGPAILVAEGTVWL
jgi:diaminopimelate epimerase